MEYMNTEYIAEKILTSQPSEDTKVVEAAKIGVLDYIASSLMASDEPELETAKKVYSHGDARDMAVLNGIRAHLLDIDDAHSEVRGHPGAVILSALFAAASPDTSGKEFLDAYIIGTEVMARLGESVNQEHYLRGFHNTATLGGIAAAAALVRLFHFDKEETASALGIGATLGSGLRAEFGSTVKALHVGAAAKNGVEAVYLTKSGIRGDGDVLFKKFGFFDVMGFKDDEHTDQSRREIYGRAWKKEWGKSWRIESPGLWLKRYPFCSAAMAGCDAAQELRKRHPYKADEIQSVEIGFFPGRDTALYATAPETGEQGRFSIEYIVWLNLLGISCSPDRFSPAKLPEDIKSALKRIHRITLVPDADQPYTRVRVIGTDGTVDTEQVSAPKGSPGNPLSFKEEEAKLAIAMPGQVNEQKIIIEEVKNLENRTIRKLAEALWQD